MTSKSPSWPELLEADPRAGMDLLRFVAGANAEGVQVLLRIQRKGHPSLLVGIEDERYDPEDAEMIGRGGAALIATEYARMLREGDPAVDPLPSDTENLDERLESLRRTGAYIAAQIDQLIAQKAGLA